MLRGLGLLGAPLGSHLLAGGSVRSPRSLRKQERERTVSPPHLLGGVRGRGGGRAGHSVCFTALRAISPPGLLSHHFLPREGKPGLILPGTAGVGLGHSGDRSQF